eukprot:Selendium_serpulae@DN6496_c1_g1_i19.p1
METHSDFQRRCDPRWCDGNGLTGATGMSGSVKQHTQYTAIHLMFRVKNKIGSSTVLLHVPTVLLHVPLYFFPKINFLNIETNKQTNSRSGFELDTAWAWHRSCKVDRGLTDVDNHRMT